MSALGPAWTGLVLGLALGLVLYRVSLCIIQEMLRRTMKSEPDLPGLPELPRLLRPIRIMLAAASFAIFPALGYAVGRASGP